jgi:hypothetical protein
MNRVLARILVRIAQEEAIRFNASGGCGDGYSRGMRDDNGQGRRDLTPRAVRLSEVGGGSRKTGGASSRGEVRNGTKICEEGKKDRTGLSLDGSRIEGRREVG